MRKHVVIAILLIVSAIILQTIVVINVADFTTKQTEYSGNAAGVARLCLNRAMSINTTCPESFNQSTSLENWTQVCNFGLEHPFGYKLYFDPSSIAQGVFAYIPNGTDILIINGTQQAIGERSITFEIMDLSECPFIQYYTYFFEIYDINDPPELVLEFPSLQIPEGITLSAYFLNQYFTDPDPADILNYTFTNVGAFIITIDPVSTEVRVTNPSGNCQDGVLYFTATDPGNLSIDSNMIELIAQCAPEQSSPAASGGGVESEQCAPNWQCRPWSPCLRNETRYRDCYDLKACNIDKLDRRFWEECEYIELEDPEMSFPDQPFERQEDEQVRIETPRPITSQEEDGFMTYLLFGILTVSVLTASYLAFRQQIRTLYAKAMWYLTKKQRKELLLSDKDKETILKQLNNLEIKIQLDKKYLTNSDTIQELLSIYRIYFSRALKIQLEFTLDDANKRIETLIHPDLKNSFIKTILRIITLERHKVELSSSYIRLLVQQLRNYILSTSSILKSDLNFKIAEIEIKGSSSQKIINMIHNAYAALEFLELETAQKYYLRTLVEYEKLSDKEKSSLQPEIYQLYYNIKYVVSWSKKKVNIYNEQKTIK
jgi:hypothetical protein